MINEKFLVRILEEIYKACNEESVFQIQERIGDLLKELNKSSKPSLKNEFKASAGKKIINVKQGKLPSQLLEEEDSKEPSPKPCPDCNGKGEGYTLTEVITCPRCKGQGFIKS